MVGREPRTTSGLALSLRRRFEELEGGATSERTIPPKGSSRSRGSGVDAPPVELPAGVRDRFTTRVAHWLAGDRVRRDALMPGLRADIELLAEAGARARLAEALRVVEDQVAEEDGGHGEGHEIDPGSLVLLELLRGCMRWDDELAVRLDRSRRPR
ncbi:MAG: hypothetical protein EA352_11740 [Gemmatimonadales bacterium]|nr:MAG: hypothetical protein EA352_11740 [Gemmatimonadales bacterium]